MAKILIVDDEPNIAEMLAEFLVEESHTVCTAENSDQALSFLNENNFDIVITDIFMPGLDGVGLLKRIHSFAPDSLVILMTGNPSVESATESVRENAIDYITKPITRGTIKKTVERALQIKLLQDEKKRLEKENRDYRIKLQNRVEEQTRELRKLANAVEQSPVSIFITDFNGKIEYVNPKFSKLTGYSEKEVIGKNPRFLQSGEMPKKAYGQLWKTIKAGNEWRGELHNKKKNGDLYWEDVVISAIRNDKGDISHFLAVKEDITARKEMEKQVIEISEHEQRRIGRDLHDGLGQELTGIAMMAKVLAKKLEKKCISEVADADTIAELINRSLSNTRNLSKGLYPARLEIDGLANTLQELSETVKKLHKIACTFTCNRWLKFKDVSTETHFFRIAQEAVNNAVRHGKAKNIDISLKHNEHEIILLVQDDGIGILPEKKRRKGLGLFTMKNRAGLINANLEIKPNTKGGTTIKCSKGINQIY